MAVEEKEDYKGRRKREVKNVQDQTNDIWAPPIPPYVTVDDLSMYRKKKHHFEELRDNLKVEEGSFKHIKSEYRRRFINFYEALKATLNGKDFLGLKSETLITPLQLEGTSAIQSEYNDSFNKQALQRSNDPSYKLMNERLDNEASNRLHLLEDHHNKLRKSPRRHLNRRPTNLKIEGDFYHITEHADKFIEYLLAKRAELCRTPTNLKIGTGEMESKTETTDQFIKYENMDRTNLCRKLTNLHLDGDLVIRSEKQEQFKPYEIQSRPPLVKKSTNLHLEGDHTLVPEYTHQYVQYTNPERAGPILPLHNLKSARLFENSIEEPRVHGRSSPLIPFLRESYSYHDFNEDKKLRSHSSSRYPSTTSLNKTSSHPNLSKSATVDDRNGMKKSPQRIDRNSLKTPKKNAYLDFKDSRSNSLDGGRQRKESSVSKFTGSGKLFGQPEYKSAFIDFPRERARIRRPETNFTNDGEVEYLTEKSDKYRQYQPTGKPQLSRRKSGQIFDDPFEKSVDEKVSYDGKFECQPEYRKAYIDYLIREKPPPGQRRRILEIPDININDQLLTDIENSSPNDKIEKTKPTSREGRPQSSKQSASSIVPSTPNSLKKVSQTNITENTKQSPEKKQRVFKRSTTPSPVPTDKLKSSTPSPQRVGNWRRSEFMESVASDSNVWNSMEADPSFFVLNDRVQSRRAIRNNLYKEQRWMPSWYNGGV